MHDQHSPRTRRERLAQRCEIDTTASIIEKWIGNELTVGKIGEKFKQRVAGRGNEYFVAGIAQQSKNMAVAFAGPGCEDDAFRIDALSRRSKSYSPMVVTGDSFARLAEPFAFRQISERPRIGQRRENSLLGIGNPAFGGIRDGQVQQLFARAAMRVKRLCEPILIQTPFCARGEHEGDKRPLELYHPCLAWG